MAIKPNLEFTKRRALERHGFRVVGQDIDHFEISYGRQRRVVAFGQGVATRAWEACLDMRPELREAAQP